MRAPTERLASAAAARQRSPRRSLARTCTASTCQTSTRSDSCIANHPVLTKQNLNCVSQSSLPGMTADLRCSRVFLKRHWTCMCFFSNAVVIACPCIICAGCSGGWRRRDAAGWFMSSHAFIVGSCRVVLHCWFISSRAFTVDSCRVVLHCRSRISVAMKVHALVHLMHTWCCCS